MKWLQQVGVLLQTVANHINKLEAENKKLKRTVEDLQRQLAVAQGRR